MRRPLAVLAVGWALAAGCARAQTGYQAEPIAPDPALKSVQIPESVLMRAGYEARHRDCVDADKHMQDALRDRPGWWAAYEVQLTCARGEANDAAAAAALSALIQWMPQYWLWWRERALVEAHQTKMQAAISDMTRAIQLRPWDATLYAQRSAWREAMGNFAPAYADAVKVHLLTPTLGAPLERLARLAVRARRSDAESQRDHALAEINPEELPMPSRSDASLPVEKMPLEELLLRAGYALRTNRNDLALRFVQASLAGRPDTVGALELYYELWKRGAVDEATARAALEQLTRLNGENPEYDRWLLEMAHTNAERLELYRAMVAVEPYDAKGYAELGNFELTLQAQTAAMEPSLSTKVPGLNEVPELPSGNPASRSTTLPAPQVYRETPQPQSASRNANADGRASGSAEANFRHAIDLDPCEPAYYFGLAQALNKRSAFPLEIMALNMALIGDPDNADYKAARAKLP